METLYIKTGNGHMSINIDEFFPCNAVRFRKLFRIINQFSYLNNVQQMTEQLKEHFKEQMDTLDARRKEEAAAYWKWRQKYVECGDITASGKYPNGVRVQKEELKKLKEEYRDAKKWAHGYEADFKQHTRRLEAYKKNLEMLEQVG